MLVPPGTMVGKWKPLGCSMALLALPFPAGETPPFLQDSTQEPVALWPFPEAVNTTALCRPMTLTASAWCPYVALTYRNSCCLHLGLAHGI